jgi:hypothetical protein
MRLHEFVNLQEEASVGATASGSVATVAMPLGAVQRRIPADSFFIGVETTDSTPNTPKEYKTYKEKSKV